MPHFLAYPKRWQDYAATIVGGVFVNLVWASATVAVMTVMGIEVTPVAGEDIFGSWRQLALMWPPVGLEELLFRAPLAIPVAFGLERGLAPLVVALSMLFGWAHGGGIPHIIVQGGVGLVLSLIFLKCGGLYHRPIRGWLCSTASHGLYDSAIWLAVFFGGP